MRIHLRYFFVTTTLIIIMSLVYIFVKENNSWECKFIVKEPLSLGSFDVFLPVIYVVTPTYSRPTQKADLTRMSHTLMHIPNLHWIVVEDGTTTTKLVENLLNRSSIRYTHLYASTPTQYKLTASNPRWLKPRGVQQRNAAIDWLRTMISKDAANGVVYFGDDDNTYDLDLFNEIRYTNKVSVWPVGLVGGLKWEGPKIENGKVVGWVTAWKPERGFAIDMAGFAVNLELLLRIPAAKFNFSVPRGYLETSFLTHLIKIDELEPKAANCTKVLVWHTRTEKARFLPESQIRKSGFYEVEDIEV